jgi:hypothetical protein
MWIQFQTEYETRFMKSNWLSLGSTYETNCEATTDYHRITVKFKAMFSSKKIWNNYGIILQPRDKRIKLTVVWWITLVTRYVTLVLHLSHQLLPRYVIFSNLRDRKRKVEKSSEEAQRIYGFK